MLLFKTHTPQTRLPSAVNNCATLLPMPLPAPVTNEIVFESISGSIHTYNNVSTKSLLSFFLSENNNKRKQV